MYEAMMMLSILTEYSLGHRLGDEIILTHLLNDYHVEEAVLHVRLPALFCEAADIPDERTGLSCPRRLLAIRDRGEFDVKSVERCDLLKAGDNECKRAEALFQISGCRHARIGRQTSDTGHDEQLIPGDTNVNPSTLSRFEDVKSLFKIGNLDIYRENILCPYGITPSVTSSSVSTSARP